MFRMDKAQSRIPEASWAFRLKHSNKSFYCSRLKGNIRCKSRGLRGSGYAAFNLLLTPIRSDILTALKLAQKEHDEKYWLRVWEFQCPCEYIRTSLALVEFSVFAIILCTSGHASLCWGHCRKITRYTSWGRGNIPEQDLFLVLRACRTYQHSCDVKCQKRTRWK